MLVFFDLNYIPLRNFWLHGRVQLLIKIGRLELELPQKPLKILPFRVSDWYDWVKGIEPYRDTKLYLQQVEDLENQINQVGLQNLDETILQDLRDRSITMIETNPFLIARKTGTLERIKNKMRRHIFNTKEASAKDAFSIFWSREYLTQKFVRQELNFFDQEIKPLIESNYFRPVGENGELACVGTTSQIGPGRHYDGGVFLGQGSVAVVVARGVVAVQDHQSVDRPAITICAPVRNASTSGNAPR